MASLQDRRRVLGPPDLVPLNWPKAGQQLGSQDSKDEIEKQINTVLPTFLKQHVVDNASGSAYLETGPIKVQCMVNGPLPIRGSFKDQADLVVEAKVSAVAQNDDSVSAIEKRLSAVIRTALLPSILLEKYPKSQINIVLVFLSGVSNITEDAMAASAINAATIALADACISLKDLVSAVSFSFSPKTEEPNYALAKSLSPAVDPWCLASYMSATETMTGMWCRGNIDQQILVQMTQVSLEASKYMRKYINGALLHHFTQTEKNLK